MPSIDPQPQWLKVDRGELKSTAFFPFFFLFSVRAQVAYTVQAKPHANSPPTRLQKARTLASFWRQTSKFQEIEGYFIVKAFISPMNVSLSLTPLTLD